MQSQIKCLPGGQSLASAASSPPATFCRWGRWGRWRWGWPPAPVWKGVWKVNEEISRQKTLKLQVGQIALGLASSSCLEGVESEEVIKAKTAEYTWGADGNPSCLQLLGEI